MAESDGGALAARSAEVLIRARVAMGRPSQLLLIAVVYLAGAAVAQAGALFGMATRPSVSPG